MSSALKAFVSEGHVVITFPENALRSQEREEFIAFTKAEWTARQSRLTECEAEALANEVDSDWWSRNRDRILKSIGEA
jgi:hypothetical protein